MKTIVLQTELDERLVASIDGDEIGIWVEDRHGLDIWHPRDDLGIGFDAKHLKTLIKIFEDQK